MNEKSDTLRLGNILQGWVNDIVAIFTTITICTVHLYKVYFFYQ